MTQAPGVEVFPDAFTTIMSEWYECDVMAKH
jgi:hypothetical protein